MPFRILGYGVVLHPNMAPVRQQRRELELNIMPGRWIVPTHSFPDAALGVFEISEPDELRSLLVVFELMTKRRTRHGVILPGQGQPGLAVYHWLERQGGAGKTVKYTAHQISVPDGHPSNATIAARTVEHHGAEQKTAQIALLTSSYRVLKPKRCQAFIRECSTIVRGGL
jgi:hypothetical protein